MINKELLQIISSIIGIEEKTFEINENTNLIYDLGFDSFKLVTLIIEVETHFNIIIEDNDLDIDKIALVGYLNKLIN